ncbi:glucose-6-phosphate dehydrogenase [Flaviaesturariibacter aridisoli]|uniref:Glucose-6-phosphate 1-dehydrogenase n=1 Tax=Flaviaesturariibacter aridisoli TaxID=2545761 RepID=A0A4V2WN73_9BACT|nr:glucose-6-phosphate dehydrogenase [Flaviaesturariibacter aridisoli]TCZ74202.1 glucose-6-phosphate dehydrogenase [Flaviaesturariibacter aridisoli]
MAPTLIYIFGGTGDLAHRKLIPALFNLYIDGYLPGPFTIVGVGRSKIEESTYRAQMRKSIKEFARRSELTTKYWSKFSKNITFQTHDLNSDKSYKEMAAGWKAFQEEHGKESQIIFYLSVAPQLAPVIAKRLHGHRLCHDPKRSRMVFEKPFGHDLASAQELNVMLGKLFREEQIYRIDHFLGKETVQNILALRFANALFEPIWNANYIDHVQITAAETVSIESRGSYYESSGALRDMVQNHVLQMLCMVAMEAPISFEADEIRNKKLDVLQALRHMRPEDVHRYAVRGQYGPGWSKGKKAAGYRQEKAVDPQSNVETFAAVKFYVDNWRWKDVPFYVRTGKTLAAKETLITVQFRPAPDYAFPDEAAHTWRPNRLVIGIAPKMDIRLRFQAKQPGPSMTLRPVDMVFSYASRDEEDCQPEAYETLLQDVIEGNPTLFMRADQVEAAWKAIQPIMEVWGHKPPVDFPNYTPGSWGPEDAEALIARDGFNWATLPEV